MALVKAGMRVIGVGIVTLPLETGVTGLAALFQNVIGLRDAVALLCGAGVAAREEYVGLTDGNKGPGFVVGRN